MMSGIEVLFDALEYAKEQEKIHHGIWVYISVETHGIVIQVVTAGRKYRIDKCISAHICKEYADINIFKYCIDQCIQSIQKEQNRENV